MDNRGGDRDSSLFEFSRLPSTFLLYVKDTYFSVRRIGEKVIELCRKEVEDYLEYLHKRGTYENSNVVTLKVHQLTKIVRV